MERSKKILLIGNVNSFLILNLAKQLKKENPSLQIDILSEAKNIEPNSIFGNVYFVDETNYWARKKFIKVLYYAWKYKQILRSIPVKYDYIHLLYISTIFRLIWKKLQRKGDKIVLTVFGSDFYKAGSTMRKMMRKMANEADLISGTNPVTLSDFSDYYAVPDEKRLLCRFGLSILDEIDSVTENEVKSFRLANNVADSTKIIACGYNTSTNQNIEKIIEQLVSVKEQLSEVVLFFQFPVHDNEYTLKLEQQIQQSKFKHVIFKKRFSDKELAIYRKAVDICIQVQNTDQFSGAMQEHLYAGSVVITGKWLPYGVLDEKNTDYIRIETLDKLGESVIQNIHKSVNTELNKNVISSFSKWEKTILDWNAIYQK